MSRSVLVCADIEGVSGYVAPQEDDDDRARVRRAMTEDVRATIDGVRESAPDATVTVVDSHGSKRNVLPEELPEGVSLVRGGPRPLGMVQGVQRRPDVAFFVGFHDRPGSGGHIEHVFTSSFEEVAVDGQPVGEFELNARLLGVHDVPLGLVSGDDVLAETVAESHPEVEYVRTKTALGAVSARCRHPETVREELRATAARALERLDDHTPPTAAGDGPFEVAVTFSAVPDADAASLFPGVERGADSRTVTYGASDFLEVYRFVRALTRVGA